MLRCRERSHVPLATNAPQQTPTLFDHLVGAGEQGYRHGNPERLDGLKIDDQLDFRDLLHRQVSGGLLERAERLRCLSLARNNHRRIGKLRAQRNRLSSLCRNTHEKSRYRPVIGGGSSTVCAAVAFSDRRKQFDVKLDRPAPADDSRKRSGSYNPAPVEVARSPAVRLPPRPLLRDRQDRPGCSSHKS
jgi:hypothetical protein